MKPIELEAAEMLEVVSDFAALRASVFRGGNSAAKWSEWLLEHGYRADEVRAAIDRIVAETKGGQWIELGDITTRVAEARAEAAKERRRLALEGGQKRRFEAINERVRALVADGWDPYQARVQAHGEIPDEIALETDRERGLVSGDRPGRGGGIVLRMMGGDREG